MGGLVKSLEPEDNSRGRLRRVRGRARVQCGQIKVGPFVHEAAVFGAKREVLTEFVVGTASIHERCSGLALRSRNKSSRIACGVEDKGTRTREDEGIEPENAAWRCNHQSTGGLVNIRLDTEGTRGGEILLCVPGVPVAGVGG